MNHVSRAEPTVEAAVNCVPTIVVCAVFGALSWIAVVLRTWTRLSIVKNLGWDDKLMVVALIFFTAFCSAVFVISTRVTKDERIVSFDALFLVVPMLTVAEVFYLLTLLALKISLGTFFLRIATVVWHQYIIYATVAVSTTWSVVMFWFACFQCGIYSSTFEFITRRVAGGCVGDQPTLAMTYTHAAVTTLTDWTFLLLPFLILHGSLMGRNQKWTVKAILGFAAVSGIASLIRFKYIHGLAVPKETFFTTAKGIAIWSTIEPGVGIIAGSLVTLRPLVRSLVITFRSRSSNGHRFLRPYFQDNAQSSLHLNEPQVPEPVFMGNLNIDLKDAPLDDEEAARPKTKMTNGPTLPKRSLLGLPLLLLGSKSSRSRSMAQKTSEEDDEEEWRKYERTQARRAREEGEKREKKESGTNWRPLVPPKSPGGEWRSPTPLQDRTEDIQRPITASSKSRGSGLPLHFFSSGRSVTEGGGREDYDDRKKHEWKSNPPKKKRASGLPLYMFASTNDSRSIHSTNSSL